MLVGLFLMAALMLTFGIKLSPDDAGLSMGLLCKMALEFVLMLFVVAALKSSFRDVSKGQSPFTKAQSQRLKIIGVLLLVHAALVTMSSPAILDVAGMGESRLGLAVGPTVANTDPRLIPINVGDIVLAIVLFCAALIVEYGSLLQKLSDDTL